MPFAIQHVQTDRGTEFFAETVQRRLMAEAIRFRPVPPRSPHLNGKVERVQRTVLEEFWVTVDPKAPGIADQLAEWVHHYNRATEHPSVYVTEENKRCGENPRPRVTAPPCCPSVTN